MFLGLGLGRAPQVCVKPDDSWSSMIWQGKCSMGLRSGDLGGKSIGFSLGFKALRCVWCHYQNQNISLKNRGLLSRLESSSRQPNVSLVHGFVLSPVDLITYTFVTAINLKVVHPKCLVLFLSLIGLLHSLFSKCFSVSENKAWCIDLLMLWSVWLWLGYNWSSFYESDLESGALACSLVTPSVG